ncbi:hypothetical protein CCR94_13190 [Rhodoblastus sphagnicola]|uniref:Uncharacterized protein n=1 Tax=Rhodoblastus sphagnicola TaxID=333368 RepID=A0A2S6N6P2_9HYPH|nr:hypothetical protein [Rhodoblastus sphagnicola]MBB4197621.1 hypothetical protein [Rhodoblastus sphagnicola]PPQ30271.1 hypothetical protein CCR94_13190 [Rhodoblastus sphagnicola]
MTFRFAFMPSAFKVPLALAGAAVLTSAAFLAAPALFFQPVAPEVAPIPEIAAVAPARGDGPRSYSYYPEQLAALSSLNSFAPVADPGLPVSATAPIKEPAAPRKIARVPDAPRRAEPVRLGAPLASVAAPAAAAATAEKPEGWKLFGVALPKPGLPDGETLRRQAEGWRDAAASLPGKALALGARVGRLWPGSDPQPDAKP